jgi:D-alanyl-D-alanine carboxypeptidase
VDKPYYLTVLRPNTLLDAKREVVSLATGYTRKAGRCIVSTADDKLQIGKPSEFSLITTP